MNFLELSIYIDMYSNIWIKCFIICNRIRNLLELFWLYIAQRTFMYMWIVLFNTNMLVSWFFFFLFKKIGVFERSKGISAVPVNSIPCFCLMKSYFKWTLRVWLFFFFFLTVVSGLVGIVVSQPGIKTKLRTKFPACFLY